MSLRQSAGTEKAPRLRCGVHGEAARSLPGSVWPPSAGSGEEAAGNCRLQPAPPCARRAGARWGLNTGNHCHSPGLPVPNCRNGILPTNTFLFNMLFDCCVHVAFPCEFMFTPLTAFAVVILPSYSAFHQFQHTLPLRA